MRAPGPPVRFLIGVIGLWVAARAAVLTWGGEEVEHAADPLPTAALATGALSHLHRQGPIAPSPDAVLATARHGPLPAPGRRSAVARMARTSTASILPAERSSLPGAAADPDGPPAASDLALSATSAAAFAPDPPRGLAAASPASPSASRWSGSVFLFARGGGGAVPLAGGGELGGSQAGGRIAYRLDAAGHVAAAARVYLPAERARGAEAAVGIDLRPLPGAPLRLSIERRIAIGRDGRDAWSAYAAGGFFRNLGRTVEVDGYAQAGVVGTRRRDLFADGAVRIARALDLGGGATLLGGAGAWGAAQPGAARLDLGPRGALRLPVAGTTVSIAGEWRARVAGEARPRSGPALTVAADF